jgi:hypothetical protein
MMVTPCDGLAITFGVGLLRSAAREQCTPRLGQDHDSLERDRNACWRTPFDSHYHSANVYWSLFRGFGRQCQHDLNLCPLLDVRVRIKEHAGSAYVPANPSKLVISGACAFYGHGLLDWEPFSFATFSNVHGISSPGQNIQGSAQRIANNRPAHNHGVPSSQVVR